MPHHFDPLLVNDRFDDPGLFVDLVFERRALLFDLGDLGPLSPRKLLRISDVFVTHRHMDHFAGFDQLLRRLLGRERTIRLYGPAGLVDAVEHKLRAYSWNLIEGYDGNLVFHVTELTPDDRLASANFSGRARFERSDCETRVCEDGALLVEPGLEVRASTLDHGLPVLAYALQERAQINIWRNRLETLGLAVGPWLRAFKEAVLRGAPDDTPITVDWRDRGRERPATLPLGLLAAEIMETATGRRIAYVVDCAYTPANVERIVALAKNADVLFIEATFLDADAEIAAARRHLTARQAGTIARLAGAKRVETLHYSPRYRGLERQIEQEAREAFLKG